MDKDQIVLQTNYRLCADGSISPAELRIKNHLTRSNRHRVETILSQHNLHRIADYEWVEAKVHISLFVRPGTQKQIAMAVMDIIQESKEAKQVFDQEQAVFVKRYEEQSKLLMEMFNMLHDMAGEE